MEVTLTIPDDVELYEFFKQHDVRSNYTLEDLERDSAALSALLNRQ